MCSIARPPSCARGTSAMLWLVVFKGMAGSGKSTLSRALSRGLGWQLIDKDDVKDVLHECIPDSGGLAYAVMFNVARRQLLQGCSVICDSPLTFRTFYERAERIACEAGAALAVVECTCPDDDEWRRRIDARKTLNLPAHHQTDWHAFAPAPRRCNARRLALYHLFILHWHARYISVVVLLMKRMSRL